MKDTGKSFIRWDEVKQRTRLSRMTIWRMEHAGSFPKRVQIAPRSVAWVREDVEQWIEDQVNPPMKNNTSKLISRK